VIEQAVSLGLLLGFAAGFWLFGAELGTVNYQIDGQDDGDV
jgi:hypothetical protein